MEKEEYFGGSKILDSSSNCKLSYVENINDVYLACSGTKKENVEKIKRFLKKARILVSINTIDDTIKNFFQENFELYSCTKIPVGYGGGFQYHILIRNKYSNDSNMYCLRPLEKTIQELSIDKIEKILIKTLKAKRRKTDIIQDILANLKE